MPPGRIGETVNAKRGISAETALRLARFFGVSVEMRLGLQAEYDLRMARRVAGPEIERRIHPYAAA